MKDTGIVYHQQALRFFETGQYEQAVENWIQAYDAGFEKETILNALYDCFVNPNEQEFREHFAQSATGYTKLAYEDCMLDFIPVSEDRFYMFDRETESFQGLFAMENAPVQGENEVFDSILYTDEWDIRTILADKKKNNRNAVYLLLNEAEPRFASFFKLPRFREIYLSNTVAFSSLNHLTAFFEQYEDFSLPGQIVSAQADRYEKLFGEIHEKRVRHVGTERNNIFVSVCIPVKLKEQARQKLMEDLKNCRYDCELEVVTGGEEQADAFSTSDARLRYYAYEERDGFAINARKALLSARGYCKILTDGGNVLAQMTEKLNYMKAHANTSIFYQGGGSSQLTETTESDIVSNTDWTAYLLDRAVREKRELFSCLLLKQQLLFYHFMQGVRMDIEKDWMQEEYLYQEMCRRMEMDVSKIPAEERNNDLVIMVSTQLLEPKHAPTRILLELARILEVYLHKKIMLVSEILETDGEFCNKNGLTKKYGLNYRKELNGTFVYPYKECTFSGYQIVLRPDHMEEMKRLIRQIYGLKPYCVWCIGGMPVFAGAMKRFTTMMYTSCVEGYAGIPSDMVVNYFDRAPVVYPKEQKFLLEHGVKIANIRIGLSSYHKSGGIYKRSDFSIPDDAFCIGIAGNRLEQDCTDLFLDVLRQAVKMQTSRRIWLIFIGHINEKAQEKITAQTQAGGCIRFLGYCSEFADAIALIDVLAAAPALGNGGAGVTALNEGKPVVSLETGDIASCVGEEFQCHTLEEYPDRIRRYVEDQAYYDRQSQKAVQVFESLLVDDQTIASQLQDVLEQVKGA